MQTTLFTPLNLGNLVLKNRIIMAPLTRGRAENPGRVPNDLMVEYYAQRASAGLILTEATAVTPGGVGYANTPGIWSDEQVEGWKKITQAVHQKGGVIFLQLWHVGRISHAMFLNGDTPVAPSAIQPSGHVSLVRPETPYPVPRALELSEIKDLVAAYKKGAENAKKAGFDGVEIHAANGYLIDQFLQDSTNKRLDTYGGSIENRARFLLDITDAISEVWDNQRIGVHLSPRMDAHNMGDSDPKALFTYVAKELGQRRIGFICAREYVAENSLLEGLKDAFGGLYFANEGFDLNSASALLAEQKADAVAFGKLFIANPDLPERFAQNADLNKPDASTFYQGGKKGYTDYSRMV